MVTVDPLIEVAPWLPLAGIPERLQPLVHVPVGAELRLTTTLSGLPFAFTSSMSASITAGTSAGGVAVAGADGGAVGALASPLVRLFALKVYVLPLVDVIANVTVSGAVL